MKIKLLLTSVLLVIFSISYSQSVSVIAGSTDGNCTSGQTIYILANPCPDGSVFNKWTGNVQLADTFSISTSFVMPSKNVNLTATYKPAPDWSPVVDTINGSAVYYYFPDQPIKGLITFYHGSGGCADNWFTDEFEKPFLQYAVEEGYAVFSTESKDRVNKQWDISGPESVDIQNMDVMFSTLKNRGLITDNTKIYGVGMSDGSMFCSLIASVDNFAANALYCAPGIAKYIKTTSSPTQLCISQDDTTMMPDMMESAQSNYETLQDRGIDAEFLLRPATPVFPLLMWHAWGLDSADSKIIYDSLKKNNTLDEHDFITVNPLNPDKWQDNIPSVYSENINNIGGELTAAAAEHRFHNYFEYETLAFFNKYANSFKSTSVNDPSIPENKLYPNPAADYFSIQSKTAISSVKIYSVAGFLLRQFSPGKTTAQFPCSELASGIYLVQLKDVHGNTAYERLIVKH